MSEYIVNYLFALTLFSLIFNFAISLYGLFFKSHYIKKVIALTIFSDTINAFAIYLGYRKWVDGVNPRPPVLVTEPTPSALKEFVARAVDPLPQALVLTAVVIGLAVTLFLVFLGYQLYKHYHTLDMREIRRLRG
ncbi:Na+/H+ antiporter subunit C [Desulfurococcus mucosus]|uniref:NADH-ubiquinone oxidoreductase chain 4L n=1 Tax=Desulfurococcus mucosus (strain ATCC 35584 / DSM 2162 / JCM 9187 / O7/1) TaxID=765177 RepID=E8R9D8_DESM0|nr:Na+/H+ antiporter subunit C [Desulfurococcus mucosus]ADV65114.1 NADH-ubiquinone oxidoreductase chain 4L [Desulfurococcus mucosus DSM 2162]